jgi:hypothetical protein
MGSSAPGSDPQPVAVGHERFGAGGREAQKTRW